MCEALACGGIACLPFAFPCSQKLLRRRAIWLLVLPSIVIGVARATTGKARLAQDTLIRLFPCSHSHSFPHPSLYSHSFSHPSLYSHSSPHPSLYSHSFSHPSLYSHAHSHPHVHSRTHGHPHLHVAPTTVATTTAGAFPAPLPPHPMSTECTHPTLPSPGTHTHSLTRTQTRTHTRTQTHTHTLARALKLTLTLTLKLALTPIPTLTPTPTRTNTHPRPHAHTHTPTPTHIYLSPHPRAHHPSILAFMHSYARKQQRTDPYACTRTYHLTYEDSNPHSFVSTLPHASMSKHTHTHTHTLAHTHSHTASGIH